MNNNRRKFLTSSSALTASALATNLGTWGVESANAQAASGYKAIVCVFLFGGNDSNNMIIPYTDYAAYSAVRTTASAVGIPQGSLLQFTPPSKAGKVFGFHPNMTSVAPVWTAGKMAVIANSGTLLAPLTKAQYQAGTNRPKNLFSHSDQTDAWQGLLSGAPSRSGWGGRMADKLIAANTGQLIPSAVSVAGSQIFTAGNATAPLVVPQNNIVQISGGGTDPVSVARLSALSTLLASADPSSTVVKSAASVLDKALLANATANPLLQMNSAAITGSFPTAVTNTGIGQQLRQVARLIDGRATTRVKRQFFFVGVGGYDTHSNTINNQNNLFNQLFPAMKAFYDYTVAAGVSNDVVQVTLSDFNRTFIGNANQGVDHAWGGHQIVMGGSVKGEMYGSLTDLVVRGGQDSGGNGSWIPGIGVDQVGGTLGKWLGMPGTDIAQVFPNLVNFPSNDLGFML